MFQKLAAGGRCLALLAFISQAIPVTAGASYDVLPSTGTVLNLDIALSNVTYTVKGNETIFDVAKKFGVGACDLARVNVLADPNFIYANETLLIPARALFPDDYSCFSQNNTQATNDCIFAGPHVYTIMPGDTVQKIANERYNITVESVLNQSAQTGYIAALDPGPYDVLQTGETIKIPVCDNSICTASVFTFSYGTLQDFATFYNTTVGQIMALNLGYNHTTGDVPLGVFYDCEIIS
ncbi:hypothetical protein N7493_011331 [Penicillium malachiteum]|uniref:LysM domain-containing protein n=1 Tax=Penicillium malachiteum TaxID=1324776 RepID=A0AAD6HBX5_9EURO|nr:hypothetical protein N7493_011331 [Penicillium malachiteum]